MIHAPNPFAGIPNYDKLTELEAQRAGLQAQLASTDFVSDAIKGAFEKSIAITTGQISELSSDQALQDGVANAGIAATEALKEIEAQVEPLRGILPEDELSALSEEPAAIVRGVAGFFERYGAVTDTSAEFLASYAAGGVAVASTTEFTPVKPTVAQPDVEPDTVAVAEPEPVAIVTPAPVVQASSAAPEGTTVTQPVEAEPVSTVQAEVKTNPYIDFGDLYITARKLNDIAQVLEAYGLPTVDSDVLDQLRQYMPDETEANSKEQIVERRCQALRNIAAVLEDGKSYIGLIDSLEHDTPEESFMSYMDDVVEAADDVKQLIELLTAEWQTNRTDFKGIPESFERILVDSESGFILWPKPEHIAKLAATEATDRAVTEAEPEDDPLTLLADAVEAAHAKDDPDTEVSDFDDVTTLEDELDGIVGEQEAAYEGIEKRTDLRRREQIEKVEKKARAAAKRFVKEFGVNSEVSVGMITTRVNGFKGMVLNGKHIDKKMYGSDSLKDGRAKYNLEAFTKVLVAADPKLKTIMRSKPNKRIIEDVVVRVLTEVRHEAQEALREADNAQAAPVDY